MRKFAEITNTIVVDMETDKEVFDAQADHDHDHWLCGRCYKEEFES